MFGTSFEPAELVRLYSALVLTAFAVRWLDDVVDHSPRCVEGLGSYSLLALAFAASCHPVVTGSMLVACYAVGMLGDGRRLLPSGLPPAAESVLSLLAAGLLMGWKPVLAATGTILAVQIADDWRDLREDEAVKAANLVRSLGTVEAGLLAVASLVAAAWLAPWLPVLATGAITPAELLYRWLTRDHPPWSGVPPAPEDGHAPRDGSPSDGSPPERPLSGSGCA